MPKLAIHLEIERNGMAKMKKPGGETQEKSSFHLCSGKYFGKDENPHNAEAGKIPNSS